jgi:hypothetical protein
MSACRWPEQATAYFLDPIRIVQPTFFQLLLALLRMPLCEPLRQQVASSQQALLSLLQTPAAPGADRSRPGACGDCCWALLVQPCPFFPPVTCVFLCPLTMSAVTCSPTVGRCMGLAQPQAHMCMQRCCLWCASRHMWPPHACCVTCGLPTTSLVSTLIWSSESGAPVDGGMYVD